jgi:hypothetical protein
MAEFSSTQANCFPTTRWSRIVAAGDRASPETRSALSDLCAVYWYPIYAFIRRKGNDPEQALDLTQDYFGRLLEKDVIAAADPSKGRFRAFLRADCQFFLADKGDQARALKRGGDRVFLSINLDAAEGRYRIEPVDELTAERLFDRSWAVSLLDSVFTQLEREYAESGRATLFARLKGVMSGTTEEVRHAAIAKELGMTEVAVEAAARRLRKRYRETLREAIASTLDGSSSLEDEIRDLFAALAQ